MPLTGAGLDQNLHQVVADETEKRDELKLGSHRHKLEMSLSTKVNKVVRPLNQLIIRDKSLETIIKMNAQTHQYHGI